MDEEKNTLFVLPCILLCPLERKGNMLLFSFFLAFTFCMITSPLRINITETFLWLAAYHSSTILILGLPLTLLSTS